MSFIINRNENNKFPSFNRPEVVGYFSLKGQSREYSEDLSQLKYYDCAKHDKINFNLSEGLEKVIRKPKDLDEKIDFLLRWIINNYQKILASPDKKRWLQPDFVCFRGLLTKICCTPYEDQEGWIICAMKFHGTIYLCAFDTEEQKQKYSNLSEKNLKFMSWGFKFEQFLLTDSPDCAPDTKKPVNEAEEFCCLFNSKLGQNALFYGAEMDGVCSKSVLQEPIDWKKLKFVELKTNRTVKTTWQDRNYRKKLLKWWCQSFLVGVEEVICGNRTDKGFVYELDEVKVSEMPKISKTIWNASVCMNFCNKFLEHVKTVVNREYNECAYKFEYKVGDKIDMQVLPISSEFAFIPDWFVEQFKSIHKK